MLNTDQRRWSRGAGRGAASVRAVCAPPSASRGAGARGSWRGYAVSMGSSAVAASLAARPGVRAAAAYSRRPGAAR